MILSSNLLSFPLATRNFQFFSFVLGGIGAVGSDRGTREEDEWPPRNFEHYEAKGKTHAYENLLVVGGGIFDVGIRLPS